MFERLATTAQKAVEFSFEEASLRGDRRVGTEHLLLGVLHDAAIARLLNVDLEVARAALVDLDRQALEAIGIGVGAIRFTVTISKSKQAQFTSGAQSVLPRAFELATAQKSSRVNTNHLLLALLEREPPDPVAVLINELQVNRVTIRKRVVQPATRATQGLKPERMTTDRTRVSRFAPGDRLEQHASDHVRVA